MPRTETYHTMVRWKGEHWGRLELGNGPEMDFSAPPNAHGHAGVLTPEDAFVAAVNTCVMMMFIWSAERFKLDLLSYECRAEGLKRIELDRTEIFTEVLLQPRIVVRSVAADRDKVRKRTGQAMQSALKYSLVANSIKSKLVLEPEIEVVTS
jgi:organic hydroperoxide reductase OsmC/OhrA